MAQLNDVNISLPAIDTSTTCIPSAQIYCEHCCNSTMSAGNPIL